MTTHKLSGSCHCGNISLEIELSHELSSYNPRACDCEFCVKHGAAYVSDRNGGLTITVNNKSDLNMYKQGSGIANFLLCRECGVLVGVCYEKRGQVYGSVNSKTINGRSSFGKDIIISLKQMDDDKRIQRWKDIWFSDVRIKYVSA